MDRAELEKCLSRIAENPRGEPAKLPESLAYLDAAARDESVPPKLRHYLQNRSYAKALDYLRGLPEGGAV